VNEFQVVFVACPFCEIIAGKRKQHVVAENSEALAVLDHLPLVAGHTLVIPKKHYESMMEMPKKELCSLITHVAEVERAVLKATGAGGADVRQHYRPFIPEGPLKANHVHFHVIPRNPGDELHKNLANEIPLRKKPSEKEFEAVAKKIKAAMEE